jgi:glycosyltransferase involved in cell wall biosynthesis
MKEMCRPYWGECVETWPVGIDTDLWAPLHAAKTIDVLVYDKVMWHREECAASLIGPIRCALRKKGHSFVEIRYGFYEEEEFRRLLALSRAMIFLCEHETQGIAYQQALATGVPILAWDRGGPWRDPSYYPHKIIFSPVSSVPYWDERCGLKFCSVEEFEDLFLEFWNRLIAGSFDPRSYILEHLTLEKCARKYVDKANAIL